MDKSAVKDLMYGGISEMIRNDKYYRFSPVGPEYCRFTEAGEVALKEFMAQMALTIRKAEDAELDKRAKDMVVRGLKGETL